MKLHLIVLLSLCFIANGLRAAQDEEEKVDAASLNSKPFIGDPNLARSPIEIAIHNAIAEHFDEPKRRDHIGEFNRDIAAARAQSERALSYEDSINDIGDHYICELYTNYASYLEYQRYIKYGS